jgi:hypothetical protein
MLSAFIVDYFSKKQSKAKKVSKKQSKAKKVVKIDNLL